MSSPPASWSQPADSRRRALLTSAGAAAFALAWTLVHAHVFRRHEIVDTALYARYGEATVHGAVPYRDFALEYPPGALPAFVLPALAPAGSYRAAFEALMLLFGIGAVAAVSSALSAVGASARRLAIAVGVLGLAPLALGPVVLTRFDLWPAFLTAAAVAALVVGRPRLALAVLALAVAAKLYPLAIVPPALLHVGVTRGRRSALGALATFLGTLALVVGPFLVVAPHGLAHALGVQAGRPLQIESLGAAALLAAHQLGVYGPHVVSSFGSQNLAGRLPDALAAVQSALTALSVFGVWAVFARRARERRTLLLASAAAVAGIVALSPVLSPQFLVWLLPLVVLVPEGVLPVAALALAAALVLTQAWFPNRYWDVVALRPIGWVVLLRDAVLVALYALLARELMRRRAGTHRTR